MDAYCPRCKVSSKDVDEAVLKAGECPDCGGQITLGGVTTDLPLDGAVAMSFVVGSRVAMPLDASFENSEIDIKGSSRGAQAGREEVTQPSARRPPPPPLDDEVTVDMSLKPGESPTLNETENAGASGGPPPPPPDDEVTIDMRAGSEAAAQEKGDLFSSSDSPDDEPSGDSKPSEDPWAAGDAASGSDDGPPPAPADADEPEVPAPPSMDVEVTVPDATKLSAPPVDLKSTTPAMDFSLPEFGAAPGASAPPAGMDGEATVQDDTPSTGAEESPAAASGSEAPAGLGAHLQLPAIDFSVPGMELSSSAPAASTAPAATTTAPASTPDAAAANALPAHLQLPSFPDFQLPPIPGEEAGQPAGDAGTAGDSVDAVPQPVAETASVAGADSASVASAQPAVAPAPPPPLPPVIKQAAPAAPEPEALPDLPSLGGLPSFNQANVNRDPTLIETNVALAMAQEADAKRSFGSILMIGLIVGLGLAILGAGGFVFVNGIDKTLAMINPPEEKSAAELAREKAEERFFEGLQAYKDAEQADKDKKPKVAKKGFVAAAAQFEKAIKHYPKHSQAHRNLGIVYAKLNRQKEAVKHYEIYLKLEPKAKDAKELQRIIDDYKKSQKKSGGKGKKR